MLAGHVWEGVCQFWCSFRPAIQRLAMVAQYSTRTQVGKNSTCDGCVPASLVGRELSLHMNAHHMQSFRAVMCLLFAVLPEHASGPYGKLQSLSLLATCRLIHKAKSVGKGSEAKQMLLELTYEQGANVSNIDVLCSAAESLGIPGADTYLVCSASARCI